jgi:transcriptional regulator with XRE-family HTH domain
MTALVLAMGDRDAVRKTSEDFERGERIEDAFRRSGMTRTGFSEALGINYNHVPRLFNGERVSPQRLTRIAEVLAVSERWLTRGAVYGDEFREWLDSLAPSNLRDVERELLACINFPPGHHPGARWYSIAIEAWRHGTGGSMVDQSQVRARAGEAR